MTTSDPSSGRSLRLLIELGRGGMGVVYLALAEGPGGFAKLKVVKRLRPDLAGEPQAVQMFLEEGRLSARLHHPNVVQTNEVGFDGKHYFLEMEYLEGQSLDAIGKRASRTTAVPLPVTVYVLAQTLIGLNYAHELVDHDGKPLSVVHRDVSPHNVMVTFDGQVKVLDFGIAKAAGQRNETKTGFVKGKVTYMAPEQVARKPLDRRVDVFAVGVMLWEALAGTRLWGDLDDFEIFLKLRSEDIPTPRSVKPEAPEALEAICMRALARDPEARYATAADMQRDLESWLEATGSRVGTKDVAAQMDFLFAFDRASVKAEIDDRIRATPAAESVVGVPMLRATAPQASTASGAGTSSTVGLGGTRVQQLRQIRGLRTIALASLGVAFVASVAAGVATLRSRSRGAAAAASASASASASAKAHGPTCNTNTECTAGSICRRDEHRCVALASDKCTLLSEPGDALDDRTIWIGAMFPLGGSSASFFKPFVRAVDLARRDFVELTHGIPSHSVDGKPRPFAVISCDDTEDEAASARHLADVGVSAVIGFKTSNESIELSSSTFLPKRILVATTNASPLVTSLPQPSDGRLVWRATSSSAQSAVPVSALITNVVEARLERAGTVKPSAPMRVAFVRPNSGYAPPIAEAFLANLSFNGKSAIANGDAFRQVVFADPTDTRSSPDWGAVVSQLVAMKPQVIVFLGGEELVPNVFAPVERVWPKGETRPVWISTTNLQGDAFFAFLGKDAERRRRFFGVSQPADTPANAQLATRYSSQYNETMTAGYAPAPPYDAMYLIAYAAYVVGDEPVTGPALAHAIGRLVPPAPRVDIGPTHIFEAIGALRSAGNIDLNGAGYSFDFDLTTGESQVDFVIQCVGVDPHGMANDAIDSGLTWAARTKTLTGDLHCP